MRRAKSIKTGLAVSLCVIVVASVSLRHVLPMRPPQVYSIDLAAGGRFLAITTYCGTTLYDVPRKSQLQVFEGSQLVAFSEDGKLACVANLKSIDLWDLHRGARIRQLADSSSRKSALAISPDGLLLASVQEDRILQLWDLSTGEALWSTEAHDDCSAVAFSSNGSLLATGGTNRTKRTHEIKLWDVSDGQLLHTLDGPEYTYVLGIRFYDDDQKLTAWLSDNSQNKVWDISSERPSRSEGWHHGGIIFSRSEAYTVSAATDGRLQVFDRTGRKLWNLPEESGFIWDGEFINGDSQLVTANSEGVVSFWNVRDGRLLRSTPLRRLEWTWTWMLLAGSFAVWLTMWSLTFRRFRRDSFRERMDDILLLSTGLLVASSETLVYVLVVSEDFSFELIGGLFLFLGLLSVGGVGIAIVSVLFRAWTALAVGAVVIPLAFTSSYLLWSQVVQAV